METNRWEGNIAALAALLTAIGGIIVGIQKWRRDQQEHTNNNQTKTNDRTFRTVDAMMLFIEQLQEETDRKSHELRTQEERCEERLQRLREQVAAHDRTIEQQADLIRSLRNQLRDYS